MSDDPQPQTTWVDHLLVQAGLTRLVDPAVAREVRLRRLSAAVAVAALHDGQSMSGDARVRAKAARRLQARMRDVMKHGDLSDEQDWRHYLARVDGALRASQIVTDFLDDKLDPPRP